MRGKKWVLSPHAVEVVGQKAGRTSSACRRYVMPVVFGGKEKSVEVCSRSAPCLARRSFRVEVIHPGEERWSRCGPGHYGERARSAMTLDVPLERGCAMIKLAYAGSTPK